MSNIALSPEELESRSKDYATEAEKVREVIGNMDRLILSLESEWQGAASQSCVQRYSDLKQGFQNTAELIQDIADGLHQSANAFREMDESVANAWR